MSAEIIKGPFWSNCFLEAAKAKIRHPFKVKVTVVPRSEARCPHFLWSDGRYDYDFGVERRLVGAQILLFRGYIRRRGLGFNQKYKERMRKAWRRRAGGRGGHLMDSEKLIEQLNDFNENHISVLCGSGQCACGYLCDKDDCIVVRAATALSTLQAENSRLRAELEYEREHANAYYEECGQWEAENEKLRGENIRWGQVASEQDKAIDNLRKELEWKDMVIELAQRKEREAKAELEQVKHALAMMWFAYVNSDKETPHSYETEAIEEAERLLGPWEECMPKYLRRGQKED